MSSVNGKLTNDRAKRLKDNVGYRFKKPLYPDVESTPEMAHIQALGEKRSSFVAAQKLENLTF